MKSGNFSGSRSVGAPYGGGNYGPGRQWKWGLWREKQILSFFLFAMGFTV